MFTTWILQTCVALQVRPYVSSVETDLLSEDFPCVNKDNKKLERFIQQNIDTHKYLIMNSSHQDIGQDLRVFHTAIQTHQIFAYIIWNDTWTQESTAPALLTLLVI